MVGPGHTGCRAPGRRRSRRGLLLIAVFIAATCSAGLDPARGDAAVAREGNLRVVFDGSMSPNELPRTGSAPVTVRLGTRFQTTDGSAMPQLRRMRLSLNRQGRIADRGLPRCEHRLIEDTIFSGAVANCRSALVGRGSAVGSIHFPDQSPFALRSRALVFNAPPKDGRRRLWLYITTDEPFSPTILEVTVRSGRGAMGHALVIGFPEGLPFRLAAFRLVIGTRYRFRGRVRSYLNAGCPAPPTFPGAAFQLARARFAFDDGKAVSVTQLGTCRATG